jgi:hypothetical protein
MAGSGCDTCVVRGGVDGEGVDDGGVGGLRSGSATGTPSVCDEAGTPAVEELYGITPDGAGIARPDEDVALTADGADTLAAPAAPMTIRLEASAVASTSEILLPANRMSANIT